METQKTNKQTNCTDHSLAEQAGLKPSQSPINPRILIYVGCLWLRKPTSHQLSKNRTVTTSCVGINIKYSGNVLVPVPYLWTHHCIIIAISRKVWYLDMHPNMSYMMLYPNHGLSQRNPVKQNYHITHWPPTFMPLYKLDPLLHTTYGNIDQYMHNNKVYMYEIIIHRYGSMSTKK